MDYPAIIQAVVASGAISAVVGAIPAVRSVRKGLRTLEELATMTRRIDAYLRASTDLDERPIFRTNKVGHVTHVNRAFSDLFGYTKEEILDMGIWRLVYADQREQLERAWYATVNSPKRIFREHAKCYHASGDIVIRVGIEAHLVCCTDGEAFGWQGTLSVERATPIHTTPNGAHP
ncbi:MAG TPA: PAS domain S-box protein [Vicinamibacterales bacterium]|nr:PAS domain S-box protein [Vicinamibacterales bacterium]